MTRPATPARRITTRVVDTPWGRTVRMVAPGSADDHTIALFDMTTDDNGGTLATATAHDLFTEYDARAFPPPVVDMAPAVELLLTPSAPLDVVAPLVPAAAPRCTVDVTVHMFDRPSDVRAAIRAGDVATGDVVAVVGERATVTAVIVDGWPVAAGAGLSPWLPLVEGETWLTFDAGRYAAAAAAALDVEV